MRQGNDLKVVTAPNDAANDEIGQNCKEKKGSKGESPWTGFGAVAPMNQSFLRGSRFFGSGKWF
ncbi:MAG: hypothetical protein WC966_10995 [Bradymonadales bacterium]